MTRIIPNPAGPDRPGYVVESDEGAEVVHLQVDGVSVWLSPEVARRIGKALLQAASVAEFKFRTTDGGGSAVADDLPDLN